MTSDNALYTLAGIVVTALLGWLGIRSQGASNKQIASDKAEADVQIAVLAQWEKLTAGLSSRLTAVEHEFADYRVAMSAEIENMRRAHQLEIDELRKAHRLEIDEMRTSHRKEMKAMREQNEGLMRMISQDSQSTAVLIADTPVAANLKAAYKPLGGTK